MSDDVKDRFFDPEDYQVSARMGGIQRNLRGSWTSASAAGADALCAGRHQANRGLPEPPPTPEAAKGTAIHAWLNWKRTGEVGPEPVCDYELAGHCWDLEQRAIQDWITREADSEFEVHSERRLWITVGGFKHSGQCDCAVVAESNRVWIGDVKTGWNEAVESASNMQLRDLAVLWWFETQCEEVTVQIIQPGVEKQPPCVYGREELQEAHRRLVARVVASNTAGAKRIPGPVQCQFCLACGSSRCPETQQAVVKAATLAVEGVPSPELVEAALRARKAVAAILEAAKTALKANPNAIPGFGLEDNAPNRPITSPQTCWARASTLGLTLEQFLGCVKIGKGDLEETLKEVIRAKTGKKRVEGWGGIWAKLLDGITTEEAKEPSVKRIV